MDYQELLNKLIDTEKRITPDIEHMEREDKCPRELRVAKQEFLEWERNVDGNGGLEEAPQEWPPLKLAHALKEEKHLFNTERQKDIDEFEQLAKQLPAAFADPLGL
ncbi:MAG: hypothetical protein HFJ66_05475 [Eggerthellaceae bacterium]|nr:hypothetical protein [Eggerthellaceae bacterium]